MNDDAARSDGPETTEPIIDLVAVDSAGEGEDAVVEAESAGDPFVSAIDFPDRIDDLLNLPGFSELASSEAAAVVPPPPPPAAAGRDENRGRRRGSSRNGWRTVIAILVWCTGGLAGSIIAVAVLWYGFGRDPFAMFGSRSSTPPVETAARSPGPSRISPVEAPANEKPPTRPVRKTPRPTKGASSKGPQPNVAPEVVAAETGPVKLGPVVEPSTDAAAMPVATANSGEPPFENRLGMKMVFVPAGEFLMGSPQPTQVDRRNPISTNEFPQHRVKISEGFYLSSHEVTNAQFRTYMQQSGAGSRSSAFRREDEKDAAAGALRAQYWRGGTTGDDHPVLGVQWTETVAFAEWLSRQEGRRYRLPTEAEWEYACRAGSQTAFCYGDEQERMGEYGNANWMLVAGETAPIRLDEHPLTRPVGELKPNAFGLYDMHGNAAEWCADWFEWSYYLTSPEKDPQGPDRGDARVVRGGSYVSQVSWCRSARRSSLPISAQEQMTGFRLVCELRKPESSDEPSVIAADGRRRTPEADVLASITERFDELYRREIAAATSVEAKAELSKRFYEESRRLADSPDDRFVLLRKAYDLAIAGGDYPGGRRITDELTRDYDVDRFLVEMHFVEKVAQTTRLQEYRRELLEDALKLGEELVAAGRFAEADATIRIAGTLATDLGLPEASARASELATKSKSAARTWSVATQAKGELEKNPEDPAANLLYGRHLCLQENDWTAGIEYLLKVEGASIRAAADLERSVPRRFEDQIALGDAWYQVPADEPLRERAAYWYRQARNEVAGLERARIERRITELAGDAGTPRPFVTSTGIEMALIPAGSFPMGSTDEFTERLKAVDPRFFSDFADQRPRHTIRITKPFYMSVYEVTVEQFAAFVRDANYRTEPERVTNMSPAPPTWLKTGITQAPDHPVVCVAWADAAAFAEWLSRKEGRTYRLPTEAEWEYACRAGSETAFSFGDDPERLTLFGNAADKTFAEATGRFGGRTLASSDGFAQTAPVGSFAPNAFGLYDMHGNVSEWCLDQYDPTYYQDSPIADPRNREGSKPSKPVYRGGSWTSELPKCASATRNEGRPFSAYVDIGFRLVLEAKDENTQQIAAVAGGTLPSLRTGLPVPSKEAQDAAQATLRRLYQTEFDAADSSEELFAIATKMFEQRDRVTDESADRFVLLRTVRDLSIDAGEVHLAEMAADELIQAYDVDEFAARVHLLRALAAKTDSSTARRYLARTALRWGRRALDERRFDDVQSFLDISTSVYDRTRVSDLKEIAEALAKDLQTSRDRWPLILEAEATLRTNPDDPAANGVYGRYLCLDKGDWNKGLPLLAASGDEAVKKVAARDMALPAEGLERYAVADAWYDVARASEADRRFLARARYWYDRSLISLGGLERLAAEKRIAEIDEELKPHGEDQGELALGRGDLWDIDALKTVSSSNVEYGTTDDNMFGAVLGNPRQETDRGTTMFAKAAGGYVHEVRFTSDQPVKIGRIAVHLRHDPDGNRAAERVRVFAHDPDVGEYILILDHALAMPYRGTSETRSIKVDQGTEPHELKLSSKIRPGTATRFRVEFVQRGDPAKQHDGVRVIELDAYPD